MEKTNNGADNKDVTAILVTLQEGLFMHTVDQNAPYLFVVLCVKLYTIVFYTITKYSSQC